jgi:hypothetical protein
VASELPIACPFLVSCVEPNQWNEFVFQAYRQLDGIFLGGLTRCVGHLGRSYFARSDSSNSASQCLTLKPALTIPRKAFPNVCPAKSCGHGLSSKANNPQKSFSQCLPPRRFQPLASSDVVAALVLRNAGRLPALSLNVGIVTMALISQAPRHKGRLDCGFHRNTLF